MRSDIGGPLVTQRRTDWATKFRLAQLVAEPLFMRTTLDSFMIVITSKDSTSQHVSTADLKTHLRIDGTTEDDYIASLCLAAQAFIEEDTGRDFSDSTVDGYLNDFPDRIELTKQPVKSVTHIKYYNSSNELTTLDSTNYHVMTPTNVAGWIEPISTVSWPATYERPDSVNIKYVVGYDTVPLTLKHCIKMLVGHWFENREEVTDGKAIQVPIGVERLLMQLCVVSYR